MAQIGDLAPDFTAETSAGRIRFHEWLGTSWAVLFSHPRFFRPVCVSEIAQAARLKSQFDLLDTKLIALCTDSLAAYDKWAADVEAAEGVAINFPVIADESRRVATAYGMIHPNMSRDVATRSAYIIGPDKKIRATIAYPSSLGRDFRELWRAVMSLQLTQHRAVATPAGWQPGGDVVIVPQMSDAEAKRSFPGGWKAPRPYLRIVVQPDLP
jgi:alkyl hydroperoxide reductase subunit AhpC